MAVGRAIVRHPKVFLFDEPLSNLDAKLRVQMRAEINKLHNRLQSTMIYVTHDQVEAMTMGDRIVVMLGGVVQQIASPLELYNRPTNKFVAGFIGSPPMNMIDGSIAAVNGALQFRDDTGAIQLDVDRGHRPALEAYAGKRVILGIRPEHFGENVPQTARAGNSITAKVDVVEPMGSEIYLYVAAGKIVLTARINTDREPVVDSTYVLDVAMDKAHYFDPGNEKAIRA